MKNYKKFLEEVTIKGNPGIPGEGDKRPEDKDYLKDLELKNQTKHDLVPDPNINPMRDRRFDPREMGQRMMNILATSSKYIKGNEESLEELAKDTILSLYGEMLDGVILDIKLIKNGKDIKAFMDEESEQSKPRELEIVKDPETIRQIHKGKIGNNIIQGEAKNTKHILHSDIVKNGLAKIYGDKSEEILRLWDELTKIAEKFDWLIPLEIKADMMKHAPEGLAGAVKVDWIKDEEEDEDEIKKSEYKVEDEDEDEYEEEVESGYTPVIRARGIDFPMLLHETVKGIYELIASSSIPKEGDDPKEVEVAEIVKMNISSFEDEVEDFRTGPQIASDFRDFINANKKSEYDPNIRAFVFGKMMDRNYMTSSEFLELFRGILNETKEARTKVDKIIDEIIDSLKEYELGEALPSQEEEKEEDDFGKQFYDKFLKDEEETEEEEEVNYADLSQRDIQNLIDDALDSGDFDKVRILSDFLKEGKMIYLNEIERILESRKRR